MPVIPVALLSAFREGRAAVFVGAGASRPDNLPSWDQLAKDLGKELGIDPNLPDERFSADLLAAIPQYFENAHGRRELIRRIRDRIPQRRHGPPTAIHDLLAQLPTDDYFTTNFDESIEDALRYHGRPPHVAWNESRAKGDVEPRHVRVRKLHGTGEDDASLVITSGDYSEWEMKHPILSAHLAHELRSKVFLFAGYSLRDPDFNAVYDRVTAAMASFSNHHYALVGDSMTAHQEAELKRRKIIPIKVSEWAPGKTREQQTVAFLRDLLDQTSDVAAAKRFFRFAAADSVSLVVNSTRMPGKYYDLIPEPDLAVVSVVNRAAGMMGASTRIVPLSVAEQDWEGIKEGDVVLICGPWGNPKTADFFREWGPPAGPLRQSFSPPDSQPRAIADKSYGRFESDFPYGDDAKGKVLVEHSIIARYPNPWTRGPHFIYVIAGAHAYGTQFAADFLQSPRNCLRLLLSDGESVNLLRTEYTIVSPRQQRIVKQDVLHLPHVVHVPVEPPQEPAGARRQEQA